MEIDFSEKSFYIKKSPKISLFSSSVFEAYSRLYFSVIILKIIYLIFIDLLSKQHILLLIKNSFSEYDQYKKNVSAFLSFLQ